MVLLFFQCLCICFFYLAEEEIQKIREIGARQRAEYSVQQPLTSAQRAALTTAKADQPLEPIRPGRATVGHGNAEHGAHTSDYQQAMRVANGTLPSGAKGRPVPAASKFSSYTLEAEALNRGRRQLEIDLRTKSIPEMNGLEPNRHTVTVTTNEPGGFGVRWIRSKDALGKDIKDSLGNFVPKQDATILNKAKIIYEYVPSKKTWEPVTYYPTDK